MQENLPFIVWLKGDEPYFNEFEIDADKAMEMIGIKRSRLTQISGKELRVGRTRIDRYIKPMYRKEDVLAYVEWTKAPTSTIKSTEMIKDAVHSLQEGVEKLVSFDSLMEWMKKALLFQNHKEVPKKGYLESKELDFKLNLIYSEIQNLKNKKPVEVITQTVKLPEPPPFKLRTKGLNTRFLMSQEERKPHEFCMDRPQKRSPRRKTISLFRWYDQE